MTLHITHKTSMETIRNSTCQELIEAISGIDGSPMSELKKHKKANLVSAALAKLFSLREQHQIEKDNAEEEHSKIVAMQQEDMYIQRAKQAVVNGLSKLLKMHEKCLVKFADNIKSVCNDPMEISSAMRWDTEAVLKSAELSKEIAADLRFWTGEVKCPTRTVVEIYETLEDRIETNITKVLQWKTNSKNSSISNLVDQMEHEALCDMISFNKRMLSNLKKDICMDKRLEDPRLNDFLYI